MAQLLEPNFLKRGDTLGVFTPSSPGYIDGEGLFENGLKNLGKLGFKTKLGNLTSRRATQGYRSGGPEDRAAEFMNLIDNPEVDGLISTIGGSNSSSLIPFLDFDRIRSARKPICGFSDVTSLHLSIMKHAGLQTIYGPSAMCWFGDWPDGVPESDAWFLDALTEKRKQKREIHQPQKWSNHARRWNNGDWKNTPRQWEPNPDWQILNPGKAQGPILALNFNTLMSAAGTNYWPNFSGCILHLEDMEVSLSRTERHLRQLHFIGVFDEIQGLTFGKPEFFKQEGAPFDYEALILEIVGQRPYPIVSRFDCGHTLPMISIPQMAGVELDASGSKARFFFTGN